MGRMGEQVDAHDGAAAPDARVLRSSVARIRFGAQTVINVVALVAEVIAFACVVVLLLRIGLAFMVVNPQNVIVRWIDGIADVVVLAFRDLFVPADPRVRLAVNNGVAAMFWLIAGLVAARVLRGLARLVAGRPTAR